jgi:ribosome recycling factor
MKTMATVEELLADAKARMEKTVESTRTEFQSVRTGRANPSLLDRVMVSYYGTITPLKQLAQIGAPEPRLLTVTPYDKSAIKDIERGIADSDLGFNPMNDGNMIRLPIPELNEERRKDMVKVAGKVAEDGRIAVRNVRRDGMTQLKDMKKASDIGEDDEKRGEQEMQKLTDKHIADIDAALKAKEVEILEV